MVFETMEEKNKTISCIMANIAWNENDWKSPSDNKTNFRWTQVEGNIPNESWNFDFDNPRNSEKEILGFSQFTNPPKNAEKDKFLIIFRSDNKIIGFYGNAEIKKVPLPIKVDEYVNLLGDKKLSVLLENKIDDSNHNFLFGKDRISQGGFNYLNPINAQTILDEAIKTNPNQIDTLEKIKEWLNQGDTQMTQEDTLVKKYANLLKNTKNLILTGAPGTGKTFMAKTVAARIILEREINDFDKDLTEEEKKQVESQTGFVQFHPSYDYTDFVEGLRPTDKDGNGNVGFERKDGVFKEFCARALKNLVDSRKTAKQISSEKSILEKLENFLDNAIDSNREFLLKNGNNFYIQSYDEKWIIGNVPNNKEPNIKISKIDVIEILERKVELKDVKDVRLIHLAQTRQQQDSYVFVLCNEIKSDDLFSIDSKTENSETIPQKNFVFIIDEINRGEVAKIFGELFYSVDPGYRVTYDDLDAIKNGNKTVTTIKTQYANLENEGNIFDRVLQKKEKDFGHFFIPENVYIIGTMNDIDRSVESMDFAFRRRFTWAEVKASDTVDMLDGELSAELAEEAKRRMKNLNDAISKIDGLNEAYHIGASYFLKLKNYGGNQDERFKSLWDYHLKGILQEYLRGNPNGKLDDLKAAYDREEEK